MSDPGVAFRSTTLQQGLRLLERALGMEMPADTDTGFAGAATLEVAAERAGLRSRRVILDGAWWEGTGMPMLARLADRRRVTRPGDPAAQVSGGTGWVALIPNATSGYTMAARDVDSGSVVRWDVDLDTAGRLAPFAHTLHRLFAPRALDYKDVLRFAWSHDRGGVSTVIGAALLAALAALLTPIVTGHLIDKAIPSGSTALVLPLLAGLLAAGLSLIALDVVRTLASLRFESRTGVAVQGAILDRIVAAPAPFFRQFGSGDLAMRMAAVNTVQRTLAESAIGTAVTGLFLVSNLALMLWYSASLSAASMGLVTLAVVIPAAAGYARLRLGRRIETLDGQLSALTFETFAGVAKLRAAAAEPRAFENWFVRYEEFRILNRRSAELSNVETVAMSALQPVSALVVFALAWSMGVGGPGQLTLGQFVAFQAALFALLGGVQAVVATWMDVLRLKPVWERARPILQAVPEAAASQGNPHDPMGAITLDNVSFGYPDGPEVLHEVSLDIAPGEFIAIVGTSGSGKSTLFRLLLGFETPSRGQVRYDGQDLVTLDVRRVRRGLGTVLQNGRLWPGDLYTNIVGASNADVGVAWEAAKRAGIAADIEAMPMGMYTLVGEGLSTLSGGQRQRVLLARALIGNPQVLLLDEATSALDNVSQSEVLEGLEALTATRIVIAHRLSTVRRADRVVVVERGRIVQAGPPADLASRPGPFADMLARQGA